MRKVASMACIGLCLLIAMGGCVGRTGKIGKPITARYEQQLSRLEVGTSTPQDLQAIFKKAALKETRIEAGTRVEVWEVFRGGDLDAGAFLLWFHIAHDKDQSILFRFENGTLASFHSVVHPDTGQSVAS